MDGSVNLAVDSLADGLLQEIILHQLAHSKIYISHIKHIRSPTSKNERRSDTNSDEPGVKSEAKALTHDAGRGLKYYYMEKNEKKKESRKCRKVGPYVLLRPIGQGSYSTVWEASRDGERFAVKQISLERLQEDKLQRIRQELEVLSMMKHPNIVSLLDYKQTSNNLYLVFEHCRNNDLNAHLQEHHKGSLPQQHVRTILKQLKSAFQVIREHKVVHRDLKLQNILVTQDYQIKLADFGFAKLLQKDQYLTSWVGTPLTMAPEIFFKKKYDQKCDIWSLGIITYQMLFGKNPFFDKTKLNYKEIEQCFHKELVFPKEVSPLAQDLLRRMLVKDPIQRMDFPEFFEHPWLQEESGCLSDLLRKETLKTEISRCLAKSSKSAQEKEFIQENCSDIFSYSLIEFLRNYIENSLTSWLNLAKHIIDLDHPNTRLTFLALALLLENVDQTLQHEKKAYLNGGIVLVVPEYMKLRELQTWTMSQYTKRLPGFVMKSRTLINEFLQGAQRVPFSKQEGETPLSWLFLNELKAEAHRQLNDKLRLFLKVKNHIGPHFPITVSSSLLSTQTLDILIRQVSLDLKYHELCKKCSSIFRLAVATQPCSFQLQMSQLREKIICDSQEE